MTSQVCIWNGANFHTVQVTVQLQCASVQGSPVTFEAGTSPQPLLLLPAAPQVAPDDAC